MGRFKEMCVGFFCTKAQRLLPSFVDHYYSMKEIVYVVTRKDRNKAYYHP